MKSGKPAGTQKKNLIRMRNVSERRTTENRFDDLVCAAAQTGRQTALSSSAAWLAQGLSYRDAQVVFRF